MILFHQILKEIRIQPTYIPDPIKVKGFKVKDKVTWREGTYGYNGIIKAIHYVAYNNEDNDGEWTAKILPSWNNAEAVILSIFSPETLITHKIRYYKMPDEYEQAFNKEFETVKKL